MEKMQRRSLKKFSEEPGDPPHPMIFKVLLTKNLLLRKKELGVQTRPGNCIPVTAFCSGGNTMRG